jgi:site-specific recombinase XerD
VRRSLSIKNRAVANTLLQRLEMAIAQGPQSSLWEELRGALPPETFAAFANCVGVKEKYTLTWKNFRDLFESHRIQQVRIGRIQQSTLDSYLSTLKEFDRFLDEHTIQMLKDTAVFSVIDHFRVWRAGRIKPIKRRASNGQASIDLQVNHLHHMFKFAQDRDLIENNPVRSVTNFCKSGHKLPYTGQEIFAMRNHAKEDFFLFVFLKETGFRRSDAARLLWREVHFDRGETGEIEHRCKKNKVTVILPLLKELRCALESEYSRRNPKPDELVLLIDPDERHVQGLFDLDREAAVSENHFKYRERAIYRRIVNLGQRAGIQQAYPHKFRHYFAVNSMYKGASLTYVARLLGDTEQTVSKAYVSFVQELRDRSRYEIDSGVGLEELAVAAAQRRQTKMDKAA